MYLGEKNNYARLILALCLTLTVGSPVFAQNNASLSIEKSAAQSNVVPGDQINYTIEPAVNKTNMATDVVISDVLPDATVFVSATGGCVYDQTSNAVTWTFPEFNQGGKPSFERIECELASKGILDRVSISPSETNVCFEYQEGYLYKDPGRTLYIADFDAKKPSITNAKAFANEVGANRWFAYPRWTKDEKAIVYHASPSLYLYTLEDGSTVKVSTKDGADYRYPHCEATPK